MNEPKNDIERMLRPHLWPNRPLLPMKKYHASGAWPTFGIYHEDGRFVEGIGLWEAIEDPDQLKRLAVIPAQLIEDGWMID